MLLRWICVFNSPRRHRGLKGGFEFWVMGFELELGGQAFLIVVIALAGLPISTQSRFG